MNKKLSKQWSEEQEKALIKMYPYASMVAMERTIGKTKYMINNKAKELGLERNPEHIERHKHRGLGKQRDISAYNHADMLPVGKRQMMKKFMTCCDLIEAALNGVSNGGN